METYKENCYFQNKFNDVLVLIFMFVVMFSCKSEGEMTSEPENLGSLETLNFSVALPQLSEQINGYPETLWPVNSSISLFDYSDDNNQLVTSVSSPVAVADYTGKAMDSDSYHMFYPYSESLTLKYALIPVNLPMFQTQESYGKLDLYGPLYAHVEKDEKEVKLERIFTLLSFTLPSSASDIRTVMITDKGGKPLAGDFNFNVKTHKLEAGPSSVSKVALIDNFEMGKRYYVNVATVEGLFNYGVEVEYYDKQGMACKIELTPSEYTVGDKYIDLGELPVGEFLPKFTIEDYKLPGKKGVCAKTMMSKVVAQKPWWNYTWKIDYYPDQPNNSEFIPMTWGRFNPNITIPYIQRLVDDGKITKVLGFNEPDTKDQSNMTVDEALNLWPYIEVLGVPIGSPAMATSPTGTWMTQFMNRAKELGYRVDFVCVHDYTSACNVQNLKRKLDNTYAEFKKPILVTEFAIADRTTTTIEGNKWRPDKILAYMKSALDYLEGEDFILGYAWFSFGIKEAQGWPSALFDSSNNLTDLGEYYSNYNAN